MTIARELGRWCPAIIARRGVGPKQHVRMKIAISTECNTA